VPKHIGCSRLRNQVPHSHRWACLGIKLASLARSHTVYTATLDEILSGKYIEAAVSSIWPPNFPFKLLSQPSIINAIFLFFGSSFFLYIRAQQGPGPFSPATNFACICLGKSCTSFGSAQAGLVPRTDISLTTSALFPYANYKVSCL
jgi:hypothetical protein